MWDGDSGERGYDGREGYFVLLPISLRNMDQASISRGERPTSSCTSNLISRSPLFVASCPSLVEVREQRRAEVGERTRNVVSRGTIDGKPRGSDACWCIHRQLKRRRSSS